MNFAYDWQLSAPPGYSEHHTGYAIDIGDATDPATYFEPGEWKFLFYLSCFSVNLSTSYLDDNASMDHLFSKILKSISQFGAALRIHVHTPTHTLAQY